MLRFLSLVSALAVLAIGCASSSNGAEGGDDSRATGGGASYYTPGGGSSNDGSLRSGGYTVATSDLLNQIENAACATWDSELKVAPSMLNFVVDTSGSMADLAPYSTSSKWDVTRDALSSAIDTVLPETTAVGILLYPNEVTVPNDLTADSASLPVDTCINVSAMVQIAPLGASGSAQRAELAQGLANVQPAGGTPTDDAYTYAVDHGTVPAVPNYPGYVPYMVLITDGQPTILLGCRGMGQASNPVDWQPIVEHIEQAADSSNCIRTFVVGAPGSNAQSVTGQDGRPWLSMAARAGLTPRSEDCNDDGPNYCHIDLSQSTDLATDLSQGLLEIIRAIPCVFNIPSAPSGTTLDPSSLNVIYRQYEKSNQTEVTWIVGQTDATCGTNGQGDGWYIDSRTGKINLCPTTCQTVQGDPRAQLEVYAGCEAVAPVQ